MHQSAHEGPGTQNDRLGGNFQTQRSRDADHPIPLHEDVGDISLMNFQTRRALKFALDPKLIGLLVALRAGGADRWPFGGIKHPPLDRGGIGVDPHDPAQGINFTDHVAFAESANRRVAGHLADRVEVLGQHRHLAAKPRRCQGGFHTGMTRPDHQDIISFRITKHRRAEIIRLANHPLKPGKRPNACSMWNTRIFPCPRN